MAKITKKKLLRELLEICDQYPDLHNPTSEIGLCEYFVDRTDAGENQRCLIGEWLNRKGVDVRPLTGDATDVLWSLSDIGTLDTSDTVRSLAAKVQIVADTGNPPGKSPEKPLGPTNWGSVADYIRRELQDS
jgi:hypothetical protein